MAEGMAAMVAKRRRCVWSLEKLGLEWEDEGGDKGKGKGKGKYGVPSPSRCSGSG
jgi:hypothetical protein